MNRRHWINAMIAAGILPWQSTIASGLLPPTPSDAEGPFYPIEIPEDSDNDLIQVIGRDAPSPGQVAHVTGTVTDRQGIPIDGARVEIWQCDANGNYHHPGDRGDPDPNFQGFGAMTTDREGAYHFRTLRPVPYGGRTPHIHFRVTADGFDRLTTQLYVQEEERRNGRDGLYRRHTEDEQALITKAFRPVTDRPDSAVATHFAIVLG